MEYTNKALYAKAKSIADAKFEKHGAYKSAFIAKKYKELGGKIDQSKSKKGLKKWFNEEWVNLTPFADGLASRYDYKCGEKAPQQKNPSVCRKKKDAKNYSKEQLKKAIKIKSEGNVINWKKL